MAEYFSHDYASRDDEKIRNVMFQFGWEGYGIYWGLVESLYQNDGYMQTHFDRIAYEMRIEKSMLISIISDFGLFKTHDDLFYSKSVLHRLKLRKGKSMAAKKAAEIRWGKGKQKDANALQTHNDSNAIKESKGKERKGKNINIEFDIFWDSYDKKVGDKKSCITKWQKLKDEERETIIKILPEFKTQFSDKQFQPFPATFLNQERWNDEIISEKLNLIE